MMQYIPFEQWVTLQPAPDLHEDARGIIKAMSYSRRKAEPYTGRWFRVVEIGDTVPRYLGPGAQVICNLSMVSDEMEVGGTKVAQMPYQQIAGLRVNPEMAAEFGSKHCVVPIGDYVLCVDNDYKHTRILGHNPESPIHMPLMTLERGQRTDEHYETHVDEEGFETANPNRPNDGVKLMFSEVVDIGPEVPAGRLEKGDMVAFRPNICGIKFEAFGVSYRLVRCPERNPEVMGKVPASAFAAKLEAVG
jgi:hypothetical protein